jgi:uncharacterized membrane protein
MTVATVPAPWPRAAYSEPAVWRFARRIDAEPGPGLEWLLTRNCSLSPRQLFGVYLSLCALSLAIALAFTWQGAAPVLAYAGVEFLLVGAALLVYARHAADQERITLAGGALAVEHWRGQQVERRRFRAAWVRVEPLSGDRSLIELTGDGQTSRVGRYLRPELRPSLARELRTALRAHHPLATPPFNQEPVAK